MIFAWCQSVLILLCLLCAATVNLMGWEKNEKHLLSLSLQSLQSLCKEYNLPANKTHPQLARLLAIYLEVSFSIHHLLQLWVHVCILRRRCYLVLLSVVFLLCKGEINWLLMCTIFLFPEWKKQFRTWKGKFDCSYFYTGFSCYLCCHVTKYQRSIQMYV